MKFLCSNCKAKYQIADEKVAGRTLRMTCRRCQHEIVIRSTGSTGTSSGSVKAPAPVAPPRASALNADFRSQVSAGPAAHAAPARVDEWHVAINDIPVGPMRREEVARKFALGAANGDSLAWREGMDDWLPVRNIPELHALLVAQRPPPPTAAYAPAAGMPQGHMLQPPMPISMLQQPPPPPPPVQPMMRQEAAPVGGRVGFGFETHEEVPLPAPPPQAPAPALMHDSHVGPMPQPQRTSIGLAPLFLALCFGAFLIAVGLWLGSQGMGGRPGNAPNEVAQPTVAAPQPSERELVLEEPDPGEHVVELDLQEIEGEEQAKRAAAAGSSKTEPSTATASKGKKLTAEQQAMLDRMGGSFDSTASLKPSSGASTAQRRGGEGLTAAELSSVVLKGRKNLQRCYETALRGAQSDETVRLDVEITVAASGNVTAVKTTGKGLPGMDTCIARTVRMWRFPQSDDTTQTKFPVVFQPGA